MAYQFIFSLTFFSVFLFFLFKLRKRYKLHNKLPPGPPKLPLLGNMHQLMGSSPPHYVLTELAKKYGPLMHIQLGESFAIVVSSSRVAREIYKTHDLDFGNRPEVLVSKIMFYNKSNVGFSPYGNYWRQMRKICMVELLSAKRVRSFHSVRQDEVSRLVSSIWSSQGQAVNVSEKFAALTTDVLCRAAFGKQCQEALKEVMTEAIVFVGGFHLADLFPSLKVLHYITGMKPKLMKLHRKVDDILENLIKDHIQVLESTKRGNGESGEEDLIDVLLRLKETDGLDFPITLTNIKAIILEMFVGGSGTSSSILEWAMSEFMKNPSVMEKAQTELREALKGKKEVYEADIQPLSYIKLVIKETLRLHPPGPFLIPRESREECEIDGYKIPMGTKLMVNQWALGRDPEYWHDAEKFLPERFHNCSIDYMGNHFEFIPFGAGRRMCPGILFGLAIAELCLAKLLYHFNWKIAGGVMPQHLDMTETHVPHSKRTNDLCLVANPFDPSHHA